MRRSGQQPLLRPSPPAESEAEQQQQLLPTWWLFVIASWVPPQSVFWSLCLSILMPAEVARLVGDKRKTIYLGYISTLTSLGGMWGPILGAWSDRCSSPIGRRSANLKLYSPGLSMRKR